MAPRPERLLLQHLASDLWISEESWGLGPQEWEIQGIYTCQFLDMHRNCNDSSWFAIDSAKFITSRIYFSDFNQGISFNQTQRFRSDSFGDFNVPETNEVCLFFGGLISLTSPGVQLSYHISYHIHTNRPSKKRTPLVCQGLWVASDSGGRRSTCNMVDSSWRQMSGDHPKSKQPWPINHVYPFC